MTFVVDWALKTNGLFSPTWWSKLCLVIFTTIFLHKAPMERSLCAARCVLREFQFSYLCACYVSLNCSLSVLSRGEGKRPTHNFWGHHVKTTKSLSLTKRKEKCQEHVFFSSKYGVNACYNANGQTQNDNHITLTGLSLECRNTGIVVGWALKSQFSIYLWVALIWPSQLTGR